MTAPSVDRPVAPDVTERPIPSSPAPDPRPSAPSASSRLADFHPAWSSTVLGTGIVGIIAAANPGRIAALAPTMTFVGQGFTVLAFGLAIALGIPYVLRWTRHPAAARRDLAKPALGAMHGTFPAGILVLGATIAAVGPSFLDQGVVMALVATAALTGGILGLIVGVAVAYELVIHPGVGPETVNGAWLITPVVPIIMPLLLVPLVPQVAPADGRLLLAVGYAAWGMGALLFLIVASLLYARLVDHAAPAAPLAPSLWIGLGPIGVAGVALIRLAGAGTVIWGPAAPAIGAVSTLGALAIWGLGIWWLPLAALLFRRYARAGLPFGLGWWAFTFPVGAYAMSTLTLGRALDLPAFEALGVALFALLVAFWAVVAARTVGGVRSGALWRREAPRLPAQPPSAQPA